MKLRNLCKFQNGVFYKCFYMYFRFFLLVCLSLLCIRNIKVVYMYLKYADHTFQQVHQQITAGTKIRILTAT